MIHLAELTNRHESQHDAPWAVSDPPKALITSQLKGLVDFEIEIKSLLGSEKLGQIKKAADKQGVALSLVL